jgi:DNA-binding YbaB/EbfC family protein
MNIQKMMKEAQRLQQKMADDMEAAQQKLAEERVEGSAGGGLVTVTVSGQKQLVSVKIDPKAVDPSDVETLEDLVFAATQSALNAADQRAAELMDEVKGGLNIPGLDLGQFGL